MIMEQTYAVENKIEQEPTDTDLKDICDACFIEGKQIPAEYVCQECEERLCNSCLDDHKKRNATKAHQPVDLLQAQAKLLKKCEPCENGGRSNIALNICEICQEYLCVDCTTTHKVRKATKSHEPIPVSAEVERTSHSDEAKKRCEPCESYGKDKEATKYCSDCDELFCDLCTETHKMGKLTKNHVLINVSDIPELNREEGKQLCEPCQMVNKYSHASKYCDECNEYLCESCVLVHGLQKATKLHVPKCIIESTTQNCDICLQSNNLEQAILYCELCSEALCKSCSDRHRKQKATKTHDLGELKKIPEVFPCDPCSCIGVSKKATEFCKECNEFLCPSCCKRHRIQKATKEHELIFPNPKVFKKEKHPCSLCKEIGIEKDADNICTVCDETLCLDCSVVHGKQNATRHHELLQIKYKYVSEHQIKCSQCEMDNKSAAAERYCNKCEEYYCCNCCEMHKRNAASRHHLLCDINFQGEEQDVSCDSCRVADDKQRHAEIYCCDCEEYLCKTCHKHHMAATVSKTHNLITTVQAQLKKKDKDTILPDTKFEKPPGKPFASDIRADSLHLSWDAPSACGTNNYYQISYKDIDNGGTWKFHPEQNFKSTAVLTELKANTKYIFRVRVVHENGESPYSPVSDEYITPNSPASRIINFASLVEQGNPSPSKYALPLSERRDARNVTAKTKMFEIGSPQTVVGIEKTIMLVGATGTGKSTLVDGIVNYVLGVNWSDAFRFTVLDFEQDEKDKLKNQAMSQTEWITCYSINPEKGSRLSYRLNIIDTPGFGDTRGVDRDQEIVEQIRQLFSETGSKGITCIELVCFLIKAPDARLTGIQKYIFQSIMSLFGKDIEQNICTLVTFADGIDPPALAALKESKLPFGKSFTFNNSGLFAKNVFSSSTLSPMFWEMGLKSFQEFFLHLDRVTTRSLQLTKIVLDERSRMEATVQNLQPQLDAGLSKVDQLKQEIKIFEDNKAIIKDNKNFEYEVTEMHHHKIELPPGKHVTNCTHCNFTCHQSCAYANDSDKKKCSSMDGNGNCRICPEKCFWEKHANTPYTFEYEEVSVKKTYEQMQQKYREASGKLPNQEQVLSKMGLELDALCNDVEDMMLILKDCSERLQDIALRPNPMTVTEHLDQMIANEKLEKKPGFLKRINVLQQFKKRAQIGLEAETFYRVAKSTLNTVSKENVTRPRTRNPKTIMARMKGLIPNPFR